MSCVTRHIPSDHRLDIISSKKCLWLPRLEKEPFLCLLLMPPPYAFFTAADVSLLERKDYKYSWNPRYVLTRAATSYFGILVRIRKRCLLWTVTELKRGHQLVRWLWAGFHPWWVPWWKEEVGFLGERTRKKEKHNNSKAYDVWQKVDNSDLKRNGR